MANYMFGDLLKQINDNLGASGLQVEIRIVGIDRNVLPKGDMVFAHRIFGYHTIKEPLICEQDLLRMLQTIRRYTQENKEAVNNASSLGNATSG